MQHNPLLVVRVVRQAISKTKTLDAVTSVYLDRVHYLPVVDLILNWFATC